jgi:hypothetical protein
MSKECYGWLEAWRIESISGSEIFVFGFIFSFGWRFRFRGTHEQVVFSCAVVFLIRFSYFCFKYE